MSYVALNKKSIKLFGVRHEQKNSLKNRYYFEAVVFVLCINAPSRHITICLGLLSQNTTPEEHTALIDEIEAVLLDNSLSHTERLELTEEKFELLHSVNSDIIGIISIPSLELTYPLLSRRSDTSDTFYQNHSYDLKSSKSGALFVDHRCVEDIVSNKNTVIYGHNMRNRSMLGKLPLLLDNERLFFESELLIFTPKALIKARFISAYKTDIHGFDYRKTNFETNEEFLNFKNNALSMSEMKLYGLPTELDEANMITLSTCTNILPEERYAFHALITEIEN